MTDDGFYDNTTKPERVYVLQGAFWDGFRESSRIYVMGCLIGALTALALAPSVILGIWTAAALVAVLVIIRNVQLVGQ